MLNYATQQLITSQGDLTPGRSTPMLRGTDCNAALHLLLVAYEDSFLVILV
jgi:hypothetical protein